MLNAYCSGRVTYALPIPVYSILQPYKIGIAIIPFLQTWKLGLEDKWVVQGLIA